MSMAEDMLLEIVRGMRSDIASLRDQVSENSTILAGEIQRADASRERHREHLERVGEQIDCVAKQVADLSKSRRDRRVLIGGASVLGAVAGLFFAAWQFGRDVAKALGMTG